MFKSVFKSIFLKLWPPRHFGIKTFSYYLPAPPKRKNGYQEKEFDQIVEHLNQAGFEILDLKIQSYPLEGQGGIWIFCRLGALSPEAAKREINVDYLEVAGARKQNIQLHPDIVHEP